MAEEGTIQVYKRPNIGVEELIIGVCGVLQFEVLEYRLKGEYGVDIICEQLPFRHIRWVEMENFNASKFSITMDTMIVMTEDETPALLFQNEWSIRHVKERNPDATLSEVHL